MHAPIRSVRSIVFAITVLLTPAMAGCLDLDGGTFGVCIGAETAAKILRDDGCSEWIIEVDSVSGHGPNPDALALLRERMADLVNKDSVRIVRDQTNLQGQDVWTQNELERLETETRDYTTGGSIITTHVLYVDGEYEESNVAGLALGSRYVIIFNEGLRESSGDDDGLTDLIATTHLEMEQSVLVHEFGHVLGLVNGQTPMQTDHQDEEHGRHSDNPDSVMWWQVERTDALSSIFGDSAPPTEFDADDRADICAAGGRC